MSSLKNVQSAEGIPDIILNPTTQEKYTKGKFLGKGGFAKCYELTEFNTGRILAGKIVSKSLLVKPHQKEKMVQEICIHRNLSHKHVVGFYGYFEDEENVYILLELCSRRSLMELHKRRKAVTEPEARYYVHQIALACDYLHQNQIIHRDLKLGNLFLNDNMEIKVGDFGLATKIDLKGERKTTLCGTPNYIAPEVLEKKGHSYEVDAWSLGCILYTLLLGRPPFETSNLKDTYSRIKKNEYHIPSGRTSSSAKNLIENLLQSDPSKRPSMKEVLQDDFIVSGFRPHGLPTSCLSTAPRFDMLRSADAIRKPLSELNMCSPISNAPKMPGEKEVKARIDPNDEPADCYLSELTRLLIIATSSTKFGKLNSDDEDSEDPASAPIFWVDKWIDYTVKYGMAYQLCDTSIGILFNDSSRVLVASNGENMQYIEKNGSEHFHNMTSFPQSLTKKVTLIKYFKQYMSEHLLKASSCDDRREADDMARLPFMRKWLKTKSCIIFHLSNGTLQINFFEDHTKIILCPLMSALTYINENRLMKTFTIEQITKHGCSSQLASRLLYAKTAVNRLSAELTSKKV